MLVYLCPVILCGACVRFLWNLYLLRESRRGGGGGSTVHHTSKNSNRIVTEKDTLSGRKNCGLWRQTAFQILWFVFEYSIWPLLTSHHISPSLFLTHPFHPFCFLAIWCALPFSWSHHPIPPIDYKQWPFRFGTDKVMARGLSWEWFHQSTGRWKCKRWRMECRILPIDRSQHRPYLKFIW